MKRAKKKRSNLVPIMRVTTYGLVGDGVEAMGGDPVGVPGSGPPLSGSVGVHMHVDPTFFIQAKVFHVHFDTKFKLIDHNVHQGVCRQDIVSVN
jgi:hypothetical protein